MMQLGPRPCHNQGVLHPLAHSASHFLTESSEVNQAWLALGKSMPAAPNHLLCVLRKSFHEDLLHNLHRDCSYADWPVVTWILLLTLLEDVCDVRLFPVTGNLPQLPWPFEDDREQLCNDIAQPLQHPWMHSTWCMFNWPQWFLTPSFTVGTTSHPQTLLAGSGTWEPQRQTLLVEKGGQKKALSISAFSTSLVTRSLATPSSRPTLLLPVVLTETSHVVLHLSR